MSTTAELAHLFRSLKAPAAARALPKLAERARAEEWSYERFAEALLGTERSSREAHGGEGRIKAARFPSRKTLEEFDWSFQRSVKKELVLHLAQLDFLLGKENVILLGPPGTGKLKRAEKARGREPRASDFDAEPELLPFFGTAPVPRRGAPSSPGFGRSASSRPSSGHRTEGTTVLVRTESETT